MNEEQLKVHVDNYIKYTRPREREEFEWYKSLSTIEELIDVVGKAQRPIDKKRHDHQRRIRPGALNDAHATLVANISKIKQADSFDELVILLEGILKPIPGIGDLYIYDSATRVGAFLGLWPEYVYLHAGTKEGAAILGLDTEKRFLTKPELPKTLQLLEPYEIEDLLCCHIAREAKSDD